MSPSSLRLRKEVETIAKDIAQRTKTARPTGRAALRGTPKIVTCLGFNDQAEEAVNFYTSIFADSKILSTTRYGKGGPAPEGTLLASRFQLDGQEFLAINAGPSFTFTVGMSLLVNCDTQAEIDKLWETLSAGGQKGVCGWLTDKFGVSWQIVPGSLQEMVEDKDARRSQRVMEALLKMEKIDVGTLERAHAG